MTPKRHERGHEEVFTQCQKQTRGQESGIHTRQADMKERPNRQWVRSSRQTKINMSPVIRVQEIRLVLRYKLFDLGVLFILSIRIRTDVRVWVNLDQ